MTDNIYIRKTYQNTVLFTKGIITEEYTIKEALDAYNQLKWVLREEIQSR